MKRSMFWILVFGLSLVSLAHGQTNTNAGPAVKGKGTPDFIPVWTSDRSIGNSVMFQSGGDIGVGTTTPQAGLDVETGGLFGIRGATSSTGLYATGVYGRSASISGNGVVGDETATSGTNNGVFGRSASTNGIGVSGDATAATGSATGVYGQSSSTSGAGISGNALATSGFTYGVFGKSASKSGNGVFGYASATSGSPHIM